jgi:ankyrin repeat protein
MCVTKRLDIETNFLRSVNEKSLKTIALSVLVSSVMLTMIGSCGIKAHPRIDIFEAIGTENIDVVVQHIEADIKLEQFIPSGREWAGASPLHIATVVGNTEIVQLLLDHGANIEIKARDGYGGTALQWAAYWGLDEMAAFLIDAGSDVNSRDNTECTPLCATYVDNPWIKGDEDREPFEERRQTIRLMLKEQGGVR